MNEKKKKVTISLITIVIVLCIIGLLVFFWTQGGRSPAGRLSDGAAEATSEYDDYDDDEDLEEISLYFGDNFYSTTDDVKAYLFMGTDASGSGEEYEDTKKYKGTMADFLLLAVVNKTQNNYGFLQIDRNTITDVDVLDENNEAEGSTPEQICCAHWYGTNSIAGCENTVSAVSYLLGDLEISGYYSINMDQISNMNHLIGGVEVTMEDDFSEIDPAMKKGATLTLSDEQAYHYIHDRMNVADGTNENRMERQHQYLTGFLQKMKTKIKEDPGCVNDMFRSLEEEADTDMSGSQLSKIINKMYQADSLGILSLKGQTKEGNILDDGELHEEFYPDEDSMIDVMCQLMHLSKDVDEE